MIEELHLFGVFVPAALTWAVLAAVCAYLLRNVLQRLVVYPLVWHPGLLELAVFALLWWGITTLADDFLPRWLGS